MDTLVLQTIVSKVYKWRIMHREREKEREREKSYFSTANDCVNSV